MSSTGLKQAATQLKRNEGVAGWSAAATTNLAPLLPTTLTTGKTLNVPVNEGDNVVFFVQFQSTVNKRSGRFTIKAGDQWQSDLGDMTFTLHSTAARRIYKGFIGPLESARFAYRSTSTAYGPKGTNLVRVEYYGYQTTKGTSTAAEAGQARKGHIAAFAMPKVKYDS